MALITRHAYPRGQVPVENDALTSFVGFRLRTSATTTDAGYVPQNDVVKICDLEPGQVVVDSWVGHDASLGASCTAQLGLADEDGSNFSALTPATTAGGADLDRQNIVPPDSSTSRRILAITIAGAATGAAADLKAGAMIGKARDLGYN